MEYQKIDAYYTLFLTRDQYDSEQFDIFRSVFRARTLSLFGGISRIERLYLQLGGRMASK